MNLSDRMKMYEKMEAGQKLMPRLPICARLDGRSFSKLTKKLKKTSDGKVPYNRDFSDIMVEVTKFLVQESNAAIGYTQSDEITLILYNDNPNSELFFDGKIQKLCSVLASAATAKFMTELMVQGFDDMIDRYPQFDCRVWSVPSLQEACNVLLWRELDATRNSISMAAQSMYSHNELHGKNTKQMQELLWQKDINWSKYPDFFKRGSYIQRRSMEVEMAEDERNRIPEAHRPPKGHKVTRTKYLRLDMPQFSSVGNRVEVVFQGKNPICDVEWDADVNELIQSELGGHP